MEKGTVIHNFRVTSVRRLAEINADIIEMQHDKSGASLIWLDRADENKTFSIAFKTLPDDSTGVFHILEHSVLGGSEKYPVKEPFVELLKSSVQTFLNAMTYPDKTVYPVSSRNNKDFLNLVGIYLDGVFHPSIYTKPEIFRQEGWRYEIGEDGTPVYQGVVLNEMKGAYSSPDSVIEHELLRSLFPDNCYRHESGGHPEHIIDLTYDHFIEMHKKFYHPSNARISLCGSVDLDPVLELIDSYLSQYDKQYFDFEIPMQRPTPYSERFVDYAIGAEEPTASKAIIACGLMLGAFDEQEKILASYILTNYLAGDNESPLKKAILDNSLGQDLRLYVSDGIQQPFIVWEVKNTDVEKLEQIKETISSTVKSICENGLDKESLKASYNRLAFRLRDRDGSGYPRTLGEALSMLDTWLYGGDPAQSLLFESALASLESKLNSGYLEELLRQLMLDNPHSALVVLNPSQTLTEEMRQRESERINRERASWSEQKLEQIKAEQKILTDWQQAPDSPEALATIPLLKLSDLAPKPEPLPVTITSRGEIPVLLHNTGSELTHMQLYFNASDVLGQDLAKLSLLTSLLGKTATLNYDSKTLQTLVKQKIGKLRFSVDSNSAKSPDKASVRVCVSVACLQSAKDSALDIIAEILNNTLFNDKKLFTDIINQQALSLQNAISARGNRYAVTRASAYQTAYGAVREATEGYSFYNCLKSLSAASEDELCSTLASLKELAAKLFVSSRLTVSLSNNAGEDFIAHVISLFKKGHPAPESAAYSPLGKLNEGIAIPAGVGYAAKVTNLKLHGLEYNGSYLALMNILTYSYLWNEVRVQGGAYGCGFSARDDGDVIYYSYRDPQPGRSLDIFDKAAGFVADFCADKPDLTKHILGSVSNIDPLLDAESKMTVAATRYFKGVTQADVDNVYKQLLNTKCDDLLALADSLRDIASDDLACVIAGDALLGACEGKLKTKLSL